MGSANLVYLEHEKYIPASFPSLNFFSFSILSETTRFSMVLYRQTACELQWVAEMDVNVTTAASRKTSIIGTIGKVYLIRHNQI